MAKTMAHTRQAERVHHPVIAQMQARPQWEPRPFTRAISRVSPGTRAIADATNPREREWQVITARSLAADLPLWVVLGDSISQGLGSSTLGRSWVARIAGALEADGRPVGIVNLSRSGARSRHVRDEQLALLDMVDRAPTLITCGVGFNDLIRNPHPASVAARVKELIVELPAKTIVSTLPTPSVSRSGRWINGALRQAATDRGIEVADVVPHLVASRRGLATDRFHPSDTGYQAWVTAYCQVLDLDPRAVPDEWQPPRG